MKKNIVVISMLILVALVTGTLLISYSFYTNNSTKNEILSGRIGSGSSDFQIIAMYLDGNTITQMPASTSEYVYFIDPANSYCYTSSPSNIDTDVFMYTDSNKNHVFEGIKTNEKCIINFKSIAASGFTEAIDYTCPTDTTSEGYSCTHAGAVKK